jgi:MFS family permease
MVEFLSSLVLIGLIGQAAVGLSYLISSIWEREKRASFFAGVQFLAMAVAPVVFIYWWASGFLATASGMGILIFLLAGGIAVGLMLIRKTPANQKALAGAKGLITGDVKPFDERDVVFARNRTIRPGSEQYKAYYQMRPEYEQIDAARREKGGPLGQPGLIDKSVSTGSLSSCRPPRTTRASD